MRAAPCTPLFSVICGALAVIVAEAFNASAIGWPEANDRTTGREGFPSINSTSTIAPGVSSPESPWKPGQGEIAT